MCSLRSRLRVSSIVPLFAALAAPLACGSSDGAGPASQTGDDPGDVEQPPILKFRTGNELHLNPRDPKRIEVSVTPPGAHSIEFALISDPNGPNDAVLDRNQALSDADGIARVTLTAPSTSGVLSLRASLDSQAIYAKIVVGAGFAALRVHPSYAGQRTVTSWVASVHPDQRCEALVGAPAEDGDLIGVSTTDTIEIGKVPTGLALAVTLRAGRFLSGCLTVDNLQEGETRTQFVPVSAIPLRLETTVLDLAFGLDQDDAELSESLDATLSGALVALRQSGSEAPVAPDDIAALLDTMQGLLIGQEDAFSAARSSERWDELLRDALDDDGSRLSESLARWTQIGQTALFSLHAFEGRLQNSAGGPGQALLTMQRVAGIGAEQAGLGTEGPWSWEADATDRIALGGALTWTPSKLLAALAIAPALAETGALSMVDALSRVYDCSVIGQTLDDASAQPGATGISCDADCLESHCRNAMSTLWDRVRLFSGADRERLALTAVGSASVGNDAQAVTLRGSWVGRLRQSESSSTSGDLRGFAPRSAQ